MEIAALSWDREDMTNTNGNNNDLEVNMKDKEIRRVSTANVANSPLTCQDKEQPDTIMQVAKNLNVVTVNDYEWALESRPSQMEWIDQIYLHILAEIPEHYLLQFLPLALTLFNEMPELESQIQIWMFREETSRILGEQRKASYY